MKDFTSLKDILSSKKNTSILSELKKNISDNNQWIQTFEEIFSKLPYQKTQGIRESIIRISESHSNSHYKKNNSKGLVLIVRLDSSSAVTRFKLIAPLILRDMNMRGINVTSIKPSMSHIKF
tara:strand:+ start:386 stop:751 length:366 start_codon:yes stop_codon:yes gene_type:complete